MTQVTARTRPLRRAGIGYARRILTVLGLPVVLIALWWVFSVRAESFFFPPLPDILSTFKPTWFEGRITEHVLPSVWRVLIGYALAIVMGVGLGVLVGLSRSFRHFSEPVLEFFRAIPPPVMVPILMLFLGIGTSMKVFVIATGALWPVLLNTVEGVRAVDEVLRDTSNVYRLRPLTQLRTLVLRGASPQIFAGARQALSIALILMVISEMFAANNGLGFSIVQFQRSFAMPEMWTGILLLGLLGVVMAMLFRLAEQRVLRWYFGLRRSQMGS